MAKIVISIVSAVIVAVGIIVLVAVKKKEK